jgi:hypothetical protein
MLLGVQSFSMKELPGKIFWKKDRNMELSRLVSGAWIEVSRSAF